MDIDVFFNFFCYRACVIMWNYFVVLQRCFTMLEITKMQSLSSKGYLRHNVCIVHVHQGNVPEATGNLLIGI